MQAACGLLSALFRGPVVIILLFTFDSSFFYLWAETRKSIRLNFAVCMLARAVSVKDGGLDGFHGTPPHLPWPVVHAAHLAQARRSHLLIRIRRDNKWPPN
jgi:hypothetical protein